MAILTVGSGMQYATIAAAIAATQDGDTVKVNAGTYTNDFATIQHKITLESVGGLATILATVQPPNGKAILTVDNDATIIGFGFTGAKVSDNNGAGIRYEAGSLIVRDSVFWDNQDGILAAGVTTGTILIQNSEFSHNGAGDGFSHNLYVGAVKSLVIEDSYFHDSVIGHEIKSRAQSTTITGCRIQDNADGTASYSIDLPDGGVAVIANNVIEKGPSAENHVTINYGGENAAPAGSSLLVTGNTIINDNPNGIMIANRTASATATVVANKLYNFLPTNYAIGNVDFQGNTVLATAPILDTTSAAPKVVIAPPAPPAPDQTEGTTLQSWGIAGAVKASGHVLTVGKGGQFQTLAAALTASADGDTIKVAAGTYINDFGRIDHKVIIEGVGGMARLVQQNIPSAPPGILIINNDATLRNLEIVGAHSYSGHAGGIDVGAGNVTLVNSYIHGNDIGVLGLDAPSVNMSIFNSEISWNGNNDKGTHNITIGSINSLTIKGSTIHDGYTGHELSSRAFNTDIENNRFYESPGTSNSYSIDLGQGGSAVIKNNIIEKGVESTNDILINVGKEGDLYYNTDVQISGNTFISDMVNPSHPYTFFIYGDPLQQTPTNVVNNTFVGGVPGSAQFLNATGSGNRTAASATLDTSASWSAGAAPAMFKTVIAPNKLTFDLAEDKGDLDAQFTVTVDGTTIGGGLVTAANAVSQNQTFDFTGWWGAGNHSVAVTFTNPQYRDGGGANNLYVKAISLDGASIAPGPQLNWFGTSYETVLGGKTVLPDFDANYYLAHNPDVKAAGVDALQHYMTYGFKEGRDPNAFFNTSFYLAKNPDVAAAGVNPLQHYEQYGWTEGRDPSAYFSTTAYLAANPNTTSAYLDPLTAYLKSGAAPADPSKGAYVSGEAKLFDATYYLAHNKDVANAHVDPLLHYETYGWKEARDPSASFSTNKYFAANPDVRAAWIDPLAHYTTYGINEGRQTFSA